MKLEELLGEELYAQVKAKLDEANANEPDKLKHIRYADLSEGEYVGKGKFDALQGKYDTQTHELEQANGLIDQLKKGTTDNEELQGKITTYQNEMAQLQQQLQETKIKSAIKVALLGEKAVDVDYLTYKLETKLKDDGKSLELDDNDNIKGWNDLLSDLKTQFPSQFEGAGSKKIEEHKLEQGEKDKNTVSKEEFAKMGYNSRAKLRAENPELYDTLTKG